MSTIVQSTTQSHRTTRYNPISDAIGISNAPVLPKQSPVPLMASVYPRQPSQSTSTASPPATSSTSGSSEGGASPASTLPLSPPTNPSTGNMENSQLPRPVTLPPRAKPGRKPATDTPVSKRKAQNREAQRNFRDRKRQRENEIQEQVRKREQEHLNYIRRIQEQHEQEVKQIREQTHAAREQERLRIESQLNEQNSALEQQRRRNEELNAQLQELMKQQNASAASGSEVVQAVPLRRSNVKKKTLAFGPAASQTEIKRGNSSTKKPIHGHPRGTVDGVSKSLPTALEQQDAEDAMEVDFTNMGKQESNNPGPFAPFDTDESCGFCQTNTYCACKEQMVVSNGPLQRNDASVPPPKAMEPAAAPVGPGGCQACLDDPERRRICLAMASRRQESGATASTDSMLSRSESLNSVGRLHHVGDASKRLPDPSLHGINRTTTTWQDSHMTCADAITYGRRHDPNFRENWSKPEFLDRLRVTEPHEGHAAQSAQDVEIASIMAAMSASGNRNDSSLSMPRSKAVQNNIDDEDDADEDEYDD